MEYLSKNILLKSLPSLANKQLIFYEIIQNKLNQLLKF